MEMLTLNMDYFRAKPVTIPKITILLDWGYHRIGADLSTNYDQNPLCIVNEAVKTKEIRLCACAS